MLKKIKKKYRKAVARKDTSNDSVVKDFLTKSGLWEDQEYLETLQNGIRLDLGPIQGRDRRFWQMLQC